MIPSLIPQFATSWSVTNKAPGHAATGYAQVTGRAGVCIVTSGPGATNLVTPLADAAMDSVPLVAITGQVPSAAIGTDAFQEADIRGITMPITKHNLFDHRSCRYSSCNC